MKISFSHEELVLLDKYMTRALVLATRQKLDHDFSRTAAKMRSKFKPEAAYVNLTLKERILAQALLAHTVEYMREHASVSKDLPILTTILAKVIT